MAKLSYAEQLRHPKWQRKRLEVLERAGFKCEECGDTETTLNVHHKFYVKGRSAWDYKESDLTALCEPCHEKEQATKERLARLLTLKFADGLALERFAASFFTGFMVPWGEVTVDDIEAALRDEPRFMAMGIFVSALGPTDILAAVKRKIAEGRLDPETTALKCAIEYEEQG